MQIPHTDQIHGVFTRGIGEYWHQAGDKTEGLLLSEGLKLSEETAVDQVERQNS